MPEKQELASQISIKVNGQEASPEVMGQLARLLVDQQVHLPGMFILKFNDPGLKLLDNGPFNLTATVEIAAEGADGRKVNLIKGEVTALEPHFGEGMIAELIVRGFDKSHRLYRETQSKAYVNVKDSDIARQVAQAGGLQADVDGTSTVYEHVFQKNQSALAFLLHRAWRIGFECFVEEGKLYFRKPPTGGARVTLTWGSELSSFSPRITLAEQVDEVIVKGWDVEKKAAITGKASAGRGYPKIQERKDGAQWARTFGKGRLVIVDQPVVSQAEADTLAAARLNELSGAFIEAEGTAQRKPEIRAGQMVRLEGLGNRLSGEYLVTSASHSYSPSGFSTTFQVRGARSGLLTEALDKGRGRAMETVPGLVVGIVTNTADPKKWGRVKLKFPWLAEDQESGWARVAGAGAGPESGVIFIPEVGDEVLVGFLHGDFNMPVVLGGVWNGKHKLPPEAEKAANGDLPKIVAWRSKKGHRMVAYDNTDNKVEIVTAAGHSVTLDDQNKKIVIKTQGGQTITLDDNGKKVIIQSGNEIEIKSTGNLKINAGANLDLNASGQVTIKGAVINLN